MNERLVGSARPDRQGLDHHDGPFSFEGRFFHQPRSQHLAAPLAAAASADLDQHHQPGRRRACRRQRGYVQATFLTGFDGTKAIFDAYRAGWREAGRGDACADRPAGLCGASSMSARREEAAHAGAEKLLWYITVQQGAAAFRQPAGLRAGRGRGEDAARRGASAQRASPRRRPWKRRSRPASCLPARPIRSSRQIRKVYDHVGGFGHLLNMGQAGFLDHDETVRGIQLFAREVYPRLKAFPPVT